MHLGRLSCLFNFHKPNRKTVKWNGFSYGGKCRSCGRKIMRGKAGIWRGATKDQLELSNYDS